MQNRTEPLARHASPWRDPVVLAMQAAAAVLALVAGVLLGHIVHRDVAMSDLHCPQPDHALWADSLGPRWLPSWLKGEAICGTTWTGEGKSR